ncbi:MAG: gliding motility-associated C-terminal domain-containing protein, partial [Sphingobacteriales bacterium]
QIDEGTVPGRGHSVVCDTVGNVYLAGNTFCDSGIATPGAHQFYRNSNGYGWPDLYLVKFKNDGSRVWSTYYGNPRADEGGSLMVKPDGSRIYLAGASEAYPTGQDAIATPGAFIGAAIVGSSSYSGFLACFNAAGQRQWGTYLADVTNIISTVYDMASDPQGNIFITGYAISDYAGNTLPISSPGSYQPQYSGCFMSGFGPPLCMVDAFLQKWDPDGNRLWGTYYGGDHHDGGYAVACDDAGDVYMTGFTSPFVNANNGMYSVASQGSFMDVFPSEGGAFLAKFSGLGQRLWGTYYYGQGTGLSCAKDKVFLLINTAVGSQATTCAHQTDNSGIFATGTSTSAMLSIFNGAGQREYATYYGGKYSDMAFSLSTVVKDDAVQVYLAGNTFSPTGIATAGSFKPVLGSQLSIQRDAFVSRFIIPLVNKVIVPCFTADSVLITARDTTLANYQWNTGDATKSTWAKRSGMYVVEYERANGCKVTDSFDLTLYPMPRLTTVAACAGQGIASLALPSSSGGLYTYKWYDAQGALLTESTGQDNVTVGNLAAGIYTCNITTPGCDTSITFTIDVFPGLELTVSSDTAIAAGSSVRLSASGADSYLWEPEQWLDNPRSATPLATPRESITYTVTGYNQYGCKGSRQVHIDLNDVVLIPNAFSPNGDGVNDQFRITNYGYYKLETFRIFNRWGEEVFFTADPAKGWNGYHKGGLADLGTYHYYISLVDLKGSIQVFKGTLTLIR